MKAIFPIHKLVRRRVFRRIHRESRSLRSIWIGDDWNKRTDAVWIKLIVHQFFEIFVEFNFYTNQDLISFEIFLEIFCNDES